MAVIDIDPILPYTMTPRKRLTAMVHALEDIERRAIPGDIVECGVWRGGNIILARKVAPDRVCWLYDTFEGMTEPGIEDKTRGGVPAKLRFEQTRGAEWCKAPLDQVKQNLRIFDVYDEAMLRFVAGPVEVTLKDPRNLPERVALLRLDTDWYASTRAELEILYPRLVQGGRLIVDDYGHWQGSRQAVDEYFGGKFFPTHIDYSAVMMVKP